MSPAPGTRLGPYEIVAPLGSGGMGEVYKAIDTRLGRTVAIKFLKGGHTDRFQREAQAIAALNHPHICTLHDVGPDYLVMEYIEGAPLRGPLPPEDAIRLAIQVTGALEAAHAKGITHRDLKPGNILVTHSGVKLLDFGLAKLPEKSTSASEATLTQTLAGTIVGTVCYMSPEQAQGLQIDARSDIFSFGSVLHEMLSGQRAFSADTALATMAAIVRDEPRPLNTAPELQRIVTRCLRKAPEERFQTIAQVRAALEGIPAKPTGEHPSIAVLPFANMSADKENEYFSDGLAEEIINELAQIPGLKVTARTSAFAFRGKEQDIRKIAETLNVRTILEGSVRRAGNRIRVTAQLINAADGYHLWSQRFDREMADVFAMQDEIAMAIAGALQVKLAARPNAIRRHTPNFPAYEAFLKGRHQLLQGTPDAFARAHLYLGEAIALDPEYSEPHAELGQVYLVLGALGLRPAREVMPLARAEANKASDLFPDEPRAQAVLGAVAGFYDYDWKQADERFRRAMAAEPIPSDVRARYAIFYLLPVGRLHDAIRQMESVLEQDPLNATWRCVLSNFSGMAEMPERAIEEARQALDINDNFWRAHFFISQSHLLRGMLAEARTSAEKACRLAPWDAMAVGLLAGISTRLGETERAKELLAQLNDGQLKTSAPAGMVLYHLASLEIDAAADWFQRAVEQRQLLAVFNPLMKPLRESPRWPALARMMNLPQ
jgi:TolB-like protein/Tfp pilus assembly protein PilF